MNKRIKKKKQKAAYKIPKQIIRLARRWTKLDSEIVFMVLKIVIIQKNLWKIFFVNTKE